MKDIQTQIQSIRKSSRMLVRELDVLKGVFQDSGFTYSQCHALFELEQHQLLNLMELSQLLLLDKSTTSRIVKGLLEKGLVRISSNNADKRQKMYSLTKKGKQAIHKNNCLASEQVEGAWDVLTAEQRTTVLDGLELYAMALQKSRLQKSFSFRPIKKEDDAIVARIIRKVMTEYQAVGEGYSINDPEVDHMSKAYKGKDACFYVLEKSGGIVGCGGIGPLNGAATKTCELRKMYFQPEARGYGMGKMLVQLLLQKAKEMKYEQCYLETIDRMWQANALYQKMGFKKLEGAMGDTGHCSCDAWYVLEL